MVDDNGVGFRYSFSALKDRHTGLEEYPDGAERLAAFYAERARNPVSARWRAPDR